MAIFFFDLHESDLETPDAEGRTADDEQHAERMALAALRDILSADVSRGSLRLDSSIDILDEKRTLIKRIAAKDAVRISGLQA